MLRVRTVFTGAGVTGGGVNTLYYDENELLPGDVDAVYTATHTLWTAIMTRVKNTVTATVQTDVASIGEVDGQLAAVGTATPLPPITGSETGEQLPLATQGLVRLVTSTVYGGRLVRGRFYVPAPVEQANTAEGRPSALYGDPIRTALAAWLLETPAPVVWARPGPRGSGLAAPITDTDVWNQWAVLRSRRD